MRAVDVTGRKFVEYQRVETAFPVLGFRSRYGEFPCLVVRAFGVKTICRFLVSHKDPSEPASDERGLNMIDSYFLLANS